MYLQQRLSTSNILLIKDEQMYLDTVINLKMLTESSTAVEQTTALLLRLTHKLLAHLQLPSPPTKRDPTVCLSQSPIYQTTLQIEQLVKLSIAKWEAEQQTYESQLQKCEQRLRRHARNYCEMKIYCEHLEEQLRQSNAMRNKIEEELGVLTEHYHKEIQTLRTELSHAILGRNSDSDRQMDSSRKQSLKPVNTISKIKLRLMNMGISEYNQPLSCANTLRKGAGCSDQQRPFSQPTSLSNSPRDEHQSPAKQKQFKRKKSGRKELRSRSRPVLTREDKKEGQGKEVRTKGLRRN